VKQDRHYWAVGDRNASAGLLMAQQAANGLLDLA
jgi:hypothetical protein